LPGAQLLAGEEGYAELPCLSDWEMLTIVGPGFLMGKLREVVVDRAETSRKHRSLACGSRRRSRDPWRDLVQPLVDVLQPPDGTMADSAPFRDRTAALFDPQRKAVKVMCSSKRVVRMSAFERISAAVVAGLNSCCAPQHRASIWCCSQCHRGLDEAEPSGSAGPFSSPLSRARLALCDCCDTGGRPGSQRNRREVRANFEFVELQRNDNHLLFFLHRSKLAQLRLRLEVARWSSWEVYGLVDDHAVLEREIHKAGDKHLRKAWKERKYDAKEIDSDSHDTMRLLCDEPSTIESDGDSCATAAHRPDALVSDDHPMTNVSVARVDVDNRSEEQKTSTHSLRVITQNVSWEVVGTGRKNHEPYPKASYAREQYEEAHHNVARAQLVENIRSYMRTGYDVIALQEATLWNDLLRKDSPNLAQIGDRYGFKAAPQNLLGTYWNTERLQFLASGSGEFPKAHPGEKDRRWQVLLFETKYMAPGSQFDILVVNVHAGHSRGIDLSLDEEKILHALNPFSKTDIKLTPPGNPDAGRLQPRSQRRGNHGVGSAAETYLEEQAPCYLCWLQKSCRVAGKISFRG